MEKTFIRYKRSWNELTWDEIVRYHSVVRGEGSLKGQLMIRIQEFEIVSGYEVMGVGVMPMERGGECDSMRWLEKELGVGGSCVWLKGRDGVSGMDGMDGKDGGCVEVVVVKRVEFVRLVHEATEWMQRKEGLLRLPESWFVLDGETFALPTFVGNDERVVRYGQYGDMQMYMMGLMGVMKKMDDFCGEREEGVPAVVQSHAEQAEMLERFRMYKNGFLSTLMLPTLVEELKVDDSRGRSGYRRVKRRKVLPYDRGVRERIAEKMDGAPSWLFSLLWHLVQSCLAYYHGRFPDLVSKDGGTSKNTDMYIAKLGTDNAVMKYAGYPNVAAVNNEPVGVILERLDAMEKECKEWKKAKRKK